MGNMVTSKEGASPPTVDKADEGPVNEANHNMSGDSEKRPMSFSDDVDIGDHKDGMNKNNDGNDNDAANTTYSKSKKQKKSSTVEETVNAIAAAAAAAAAGSTSAVDSGEAEHRNKAAAEAATAAVVTAAVEAGLAAPNITPNDVTNIAVDVPAKTSTVKTTAGPGDDEDVIPPGTVGIETYNEFDVLSGRGGGTNIHSGNRDFRDMINKNRTRYLSARKNDKPAISRGIVREIRSRGGRFLKLNSKNKLWYEIGDDQAREKTSQCLRQKAPEIRKLMFEACQASGADATSTSAGLNGTTGTGGNAAAAASNPTTVAVAGIPQTVGGQATAMQMGFPIVMNPTQYQQQLLAMQALNQQAILMHPGMMMAAGGGAGMTNQILLQTMMAGVPFGGGIPAAAPIAQIPHGYVMQQQHHAGAISNVGNQTITNNVTLGQAPAPTAAPGTNKQNE